ncbi:MAG: hypothetical protein EA404_02110 [Spirochaetaceae bacterium]|nr:MAG: hypothetical protein EA404_02110 [Spirochaetaceae bacterium]
MNSRTALQITRLRVRAAAAEATLVRSALLARCALNALASAVAYLALIGICRRLRLSDIARYLYGLPQPLLELACGLRAAGDGIGNSSAAGDLQAGADVAPALRLPVASAVGLLHDPRVQRLQRRVVRVIFERRFAIKLREGELAVLAAFDSVSWLAAGLIRAAGPHSRPGGGAQFSARCRLVFPVFLRAMQLHLRYISAAADGSGATTEAKARPGIRDRQRRRRLARRHAVSADGSIAGSLYPQKLTAEQQRVRAESVRLRTSAMVRRARTTAQLVYFGHYLQALSLLTQSRPTRPALARRTLRRLERIYARL